MDLIILIILASIGIFYIVREGIKTIRNCDDKEAEKIIFAFLFGGKNNPFDNNELGRQLEQNISQIIGEQSYIQHCNLASTLSNHPLIFFGEDGKLPYIEISVKYKDDNEKQRLESILTNRVKEYLEICGLSNDILVRWEKRRDIAFPMLKIEYAKTKEQKDILDRCLNIKQKNILAQYAAVIDDTEEEDLNE